MYKQFDEIEHFAKTCAFEFFAKEKGRMHEIWLKAKNSIM